MRMLAILILAATLATPAAAYRAQNGLIVTNEGTDSFTVPYRGLSAASDFWCAAGDYARNGLGLPTDDMIYRASEPPRRSGEGMRFSLDPARSAKSTGLLVLGAKRGGMRIGMAWALCENNRDWRR